MSFDLVVLALRADSDADSARRMFEHCIASGTHDAGEPDRRIVAFYAQLRSIYPDRLPESTDRGELKGPLLAKGPFAAPYVAKVAFSSPRSPGDRAPKAVKASLPALMAGKEAFTDIGALRAGELAPRPHIHE